MFRKRGCSAHLAEIESYIPNIYIWVAGHQLSVVAAVIQEKCKNANFTPFSQTESGTHKMFKESREF